MCSSTGYWMLWGSVVKSTGSGGQQVPAGFIDHMTLCADFIDFVLSRLVMLCLRIL